MLYINTCTYILNECTHNFLHFLSLPRVEVHEAPSKKTYDASTGRLRPQKHWLTVGVRLPMGEGWPCHARSSHNHGFSGKLAP